MKLSAIRVDSTAIEEGEWVSNIPGLGDIRLKVRGMDNGVLRRLRETKIAALPLAQRDDRAVLDRIFKELIAETVLLDWSGIEGDDGKPLPHSLEAAQKLLSDPDLRVFADGVGWAAARVGGGRAAANEADSGN